MMDDQSSEKLFLHYALKTPSVFEFIDEEFFSSKHIRSIYKISKKYYEKYQLTPNRTQLKQLITVKKVQEFFDEDEEFNNSVFKTIMNANIDDYDEVWLTENFEAWVKFKTLNSSVFDLVNYLKTTKITPENIHNVVSTATEIIQKKNNIDLNTNDGSDFYDPNSHQSMKRNCFPSGYSWVDKCLGGGYSKGNLIVFAGAPKSGKSRVLGNLAVKAIKNGINVCIITLEMSEQAYIKRIGSNLLNIPIEEYDEFVEDKEKLQIHLKKLKKVNGRKLTTPGKCFVKEFPTGSASTIEIESYISKMEEKHEIKFGLVVVDYINIMKNWRNPNTENLYMKIKQICEDLRAVSQRLDCCIVSGTQIGRAGAKSSSLDMSDVSESMGLVHTVDALIAINNRDAIEIQNGQISFKALALRNAKNDEESESFYLNEKFMRIEELDNIDKKYNSKNNNFDLSGDD